MRNLLAGLVLLVACATSSQDLASAKHAVYNADPHQIFQIAQEATLAAYKIGEVDEAGLRFKTVPRAYSAIIRSRSA
jgi:hypothetical protein